MPRQSQDPARRRQSPVPESPVPQNNDAPERPNRKRMRESDLPPSRAPKRQRSPLTSSTRREQSPPRSPQRSPPRKRPGASSRVSVAAKQAADQRRIQREEEERKLVQQQRSTIPTDIVSAHYNAVPERGREWRKTNSNIRGLRSLNNWVKSTIIQKFSQPDIPTPDLLVLDMGCGKGGDLQKWQSAPQPPRLYVGIDPADVSIDQAKDRYQEMSRRKRGPRGRPLPLYEAHFFAQDAFGLSLANIPIIREVGFDPQAGPDAGGAITARFSSGGFDVVSMMFCLHYSYETEEMARGMLKNVAGALKKGGRFLGVMPNSDVIRAKVEAHVKGIKPGSRSVKPKSASPMPLNYDDDWDPEKPSEPTGGDGADGGWDPESSLDAQAQNGDDDWDPEKPLDAPQALNGNDDGDWDPEKPLDPSLAKGDDDDNWDPEAPLDPVPTPAPAPAQAPAEEKPKTPASDLPPLEWGNSIYTVKFPSSQTLPADGVFRPPFGWKYFYFLEEAVDVPEYVVPWEGFRALAEEYGLELMYRKPFPEVWEDEKDDEILGPLSERMGVRDRSGRVNVSREEMEAAGFYHAFCFYKI